jgi:hypothetical protein
MRAAWPAYLIDLDLITLIVYGENYKLRSTSRTSIHSIKIWTLCKVCWNVWLCLFCCFSALYHVLQSPSIEVWYRNWELRNATILEKFAVAYLKLLFLDSPVGTGRADSRFYTFMAIKFHVVVLWHVTSCNFG